MDNKHLKADQNDVKKEKFTHTMKHPHKEDNIQKKPKVNEIFEIFKNLVVISTLIGVDLDIPTLVLSGVQSAGKTSFIELLCGFPIGFKQRETATRCPVRYILKSDHESGQVKVEILKPAIGPIKQMELVEKIAAHMRMVEQKKGFSETELVIQISGPEIPSIIFVDLPGLIPNPKDEEERKHGEMIKKLVSNFIRGGNNYPIIILKCTEDFSTNLDIRYIQDFFEDYMLMDYYKKSIFILNQFDRFIKDLRDAEDLKKYIEKLPDEIFERICFVSLNPKAKIVSEMTYKQLDDYIRTIPIEEDSLFSGHFGFPNVRAINDKLDLHILGIEEAKRMVHEKFVEIMRSNMTRMKAKLENLITNYKEEMEANNQEMELSDPIKKKNKYIEFCTDLVDHVIGLQTSKNVKDVNFKNVTNFDISTTYQYLPARYGKTYDQVFQQSPQVDWEFVMQLEELYAEENIGNNNQYIYQMCQSKMVGIPNYDRLRIIFNYFLVYKGFEDYDEDDIKNMLFEGGLQEPNVRHAVLTMSSTQLHRAKPGIQWFLETLSRLVDDDVRCVTNYLFSSKYYGVIKNDTITINIVNMFLKHFTDQFEKMKDRWNESVSLYSCEIDTDISVRTLLYYLSCPLEDMIPTTKNFHIDNHFDNGYVPKTHIPKQGNYIANGAQSKFKPEDRSVAKMEALIEIRDTVKKFNQTFNIADCLEGGFQSTGIMEKSMIDYTKIRNMSREYYMMIMIRFIHDFDSSFKKYFKNYIREDAKKELTKLLDKYIVSLKDEEITAKSKQSTEEMEKRNQDIQQEIGKLKELLIKLNGLQFDQPKQETRRKKGNNNNILKKNGKDEVGSGSGSSNQSDAEDEQPKVQEPDYEV